jgi:hypothetical protein
MKEQRKCPEEKEKHRRNRQLDEHWGGHKREFGLLFCHQSSPATSLLKTIGSVFHVCGGVAGCSWLRQYVTGDLSIGLSKF